MIKESKTPIHGYLPVKKICKYILASAQCFKDIFRMAPYCLVGMAHVILHFAPNIGELLPSGV